MAITRRAHPGTTRPAPPRPPRPSRRPAAGRRPLPAGRRAAPDTPATPGYSPAGNSPVGNSPAVNMGGWPRVAGQAGGLSVTAVRLPAASIVAVIRVLAPEWSRTTIVPPTWFGGQARDEPGGGGVEHQGQALAGVDPGLEGDRVQAGGGQGVARLVRDRAGRHRGRRRVEGREAAQRRGRQQPGVQLGLEVGQGEPGPGPAGPADLRHGEEALREHVRPLPSGRRSRSCR
jgi:hypothetical protein